MELSYGAYAYRIGGEDENGNPTAGIECSLIGTDGSSNTWIKIGELPSGRSHGSLLAAGNIIYVIGGIGPLETTQDILYTEIHKDGALGFGIDKKWEKSRRPLPYPLSHTTAVFFDGRIFLLGGAESGGEKSSTMLHARIYQDGQIGQWYASPQSLPEGMLKPVATIKDNRLYVSKSSADKSTQLSEATSWLIEKYGLLKDQRVETALSDNFFATAEIPSTPIIIPGSGLIPPGSRLLATKEPGTTLRYRKNSPGEVSSSDPEWIPPDTGYIIAAPEHFDFRAFDSAGNGSQQVSVDLVPRTTGFLVWPQAAIAPSTDATFRTQCVMDGAISWFSFQGSPGKKYSFVVEDSKSTPGNTSNTAEVLTSLFETDFYTPVIDVAGNAMLDMRSTDGPREFVAGPGTYYLYAVEVAGLEDLSFSAAAIER